jgi:Fur family ferric uptake transcriptional regulator
MIATSRPDADQRVRDAIAALKSGGLRITVPRRQVLDVLAGTDEHLTVEDLHDRVQQRVEGIHLATIYRTVETLLEVGLIDHVHLAHGTTAYHLTIDDHGSHCHIVCTGCDRVLDLPPDLLDDVAADVLAQHGFQLDARHVALTGRCQSCQAG